MSTFVSYICNCTQISNSMQMSGTLGNREENEIERTEGGECVNVPVEISRVSSSVCVFRRYMIKPTRLL